MNMCTEIGFGELQIEERHKEYGLYFEELRNRKT